MRVRNEEGVLIEYLIDSEGRRIGRKRNGILHQGFVYADRLNPVAEMDASGAVRSRFVYGEKGHVPDYLVRDNTTYRIISDHLGSPRLVVNVLTGVIAQRLQYDAWGKVLEDSNPGFQLFGFAGGLYDPETGFVRFGARDYDASLRRWTTQDPIGQAGGVNVYVYVGNSPTRFYDSRGLFSVDLLIITLGYGTDGFFAELTLNPGVGFDWYGDADVFRSDFLEQPVPDNSAIVYISGGVGASVQVGPFVWGESWNEGTALTDHPTDSNLYGGQGISYSTDPLNDGFSLVPSVTWGSWKVKINAGPGGKLGASGLCPDWLK